MIEISNQDYKLIISELGYPVVSEEDLEYSKEDIKDLFIYPALRDFYIWFPKEETQAVQIAGKFSISFPDEYTFGVIDSRLNTTASGGGQTTSPFMNELVFNARSSSSFGKYGTPYDYGFTEARYAQRLERRAVTDFGKSYRIHVNDNDKKVEGFTNVAGELSITWAKYSNDFSNIPYRRKNEVINLAKANVLKGFAQLRGQMTASVGVEFDTRVFEDRAQKLEDEVLNKWKQKTKVVVMRG